MLGALLLRSGVCSSKTEGVAPRHSPRSSAHNKHKRPARIALSRSNKGFLIMQLELDGKISNHPTAQDIATALRSLDDGTASFAILGTGELTYIQVTGTGYQGFILEYQDGSQHQHYYCEQSLSLGDVITTFQAYVEGNEKQWRTPFCWTRKGMKERRIGYPLLNNPSNRFTKLSLWSITGLAFFTVIASQINHARSRLTG